MQSNVDAPLSAAQRLQQAHEAANGSNGDYPALNGSSSSTSNGASSVPLERDPTVDPFPTSASDFVDPPARRTKPATNVDISDESAFPSLGGGSPALGGGAPKKPASLWGAGGAAARIKAQPASSSSPPLSRSGTPAPAEDAVTSSKGLYTTTFQLPSASIHISAPAQKGPRGFSNAREVEPTTLGEVMKLLMGKNPNVTIEASTSRNLTTFIVKAKGPNADKEGEAVKRDLLSRLERKTTIEVNIPAALRAFIIGAKGRTLKTITDSTGAQIQIPNREDDATPVANTDSIDPDGPLIAVSVSGSTSAVAAARAKILAIVSERVSKAVVKIEGVKSIFWPLVNGAKGAKMDALVASTGVEGVTVFVPRIKGKGRGVSAASSGEEEKEEEEEKFITVSGDREDVAKVVEAIKAEVAELERTYKTITLSVSKRQHRFLVGQNADDILEATGCSIELPPVESTSEEVTIRGPQAKLPTALGLALEKANATPIDTLDLTTAHKGTHDTKLYSLHLTRYVLARSKFRPIADSNSVQIFLPRQKDIVAGQQPLIEIVAKSQEGLLGARKDIINVVRALPPSHFQVVEVDSLIHRHLIGKKGVKVKALEEKSGVDVVFPPDGEDRSDILLVFVGEGAPAGPLAEIKSEIESLAKDAADIKSTTLSIPQALHRHIIGQGGTTLNAVIGEEKLVNVQFGQGGEDKVVVRGPSEEVARVVKDLQRIAEEAKNEEIVNSHVIEFEVETLHVRHVVGKAGAGINKLREDLGVRVDFEELGPSGPKKIKKSKVTIKGRKENAEEAKKRIVTQVDKIADEVTLTISLPSSLERGALIGKQGAYLKRLETNYEVRINFPKDGRKGDDDEDAATGKPNEVTIRGGKKGAEAAKKELVDLIEFSKEHGHVVTFTVSTKSLPRILGKAGSQINQIKEDANVNTIDVDQEGDDAVSATITIRGTKAGTKAAQDAILAIAKEVDGEARLTLEIPREFHTTLIGSGGSSIRELIAAAGGPTDARASGNTVRFPRQGDGNTTVTITAPKAVAEKIKAALEKEVASLQSRVVWGVQVPQSLHASVIGKGASALQELQRKHGVKVVMPGWNDYASAGEIANPDDVKGAPANDIVKLSGPREAVIAAAADLAKAAPATAAASHTIQVPKKLHAKVAQGGRFFRSLPTGTRVTHAGVKPPSSNLKSKKPSPANGTPSTRIDDDEPAELEIQFQLLSLYDGVEEDDSEIPWVIESRSQEDADKVLAEITKAVAQAKAATHVGWVTLPPGVMPRIVGRGGTGLDKLRAFGVEVEVVGRKDANQLTLTGTPEAIEAARASIAQSAAPRPPRQRREEY